MLASGSEESANLALPESVIYDSTAYALTSIGTYAFYLSGVTSVTLPASVNDVDDRAFRSSDVANVAVADGNPSFSSYDGVLYDASQLSLLLIPGGRQGAVRISDKAEEVDASAFSHCAGVTSISVDADSAHLFSWEGLLYDADGTTLLRVPAGATEIIIREGCTSIAAGALEACANLERINAPSTVISISPDVFTSVPTVSLPAASVILSEGSEVTEGEKPQFASASSSEASNVGAQLTAMVALSSSQGAYREIDPSLVAVYLPETANAAFWEAAGFCLRGDEIDDVAMAEEDTADLQRGTTYPISYLDEVTGKSVADKASGISIDRDYFLQPDYATEKGALIDAQLTRSGYRFLGWKLQGTSEEPQLQCVIPAGVTGSRTYVACWMKGNCFITVKDVQQGNAAAGATSPKAWWTLDDEGELYIYCETDPSTGETAYIAEKNFDYTGPSYTWSTEDALKNDFPGVWGSKKLREQVKSIYMHPAVKVQQSPGTPAIDGSEWYIPQGSGMCGWFKWMTNLEDVSGVFIPEGVTCVASLFYGCTSLSSLKGRHGTFLLPLETGISNPASLFDTCGIKEIPADFRLPDTVITTAGMFCNAAIERLPDSFSIPTVNLRSIFNMFGGCAYLRVLPASLKLSTLAPSVNVTNAFALKGTRPWGPCGGVKLEQPARTYYKGYLGDLYPSDASKTPVDAMEYWETQYNRAFGFSKYLDDGTTEKRGVLATVNGVSGSSVATGYQACWAISDEDNELVIWCNPGHYIAESNFAKWASFSGYPDIQHANDEGAWGAKAVRESVKRVYMDPGVRVQQSDWVFSGHSDAWSTKKGMAGWFDWMTNLEDASGVFVPEGVTTVNSLFYGCRSLTHLTGKYGTFLLPENKTGIRNVASMFDASGLQVVPEGFAIPSTVQSCGSMFIGAPLKALPEGFSIPETAKSAYCMFNYCAYLTVLPSSLKLSKAPFSDEYPKAAYDRVFELASAWGQDNALLAGQPVDIPIDTYYSGKVSDLDYGGADAKTVFAKWNRTLHSATDLSGSRFFVEFHMGESDAGGIYTQITDTSGIAEQPEVRKPGCRLRGWYYYNNKGIKTVFDPSRPVTAQAGLPINGRTYGPVYADWEAVTPEADNYIVRFEVPKQGGASPDYAQGASYNVAADAEGKVKVPSAHLFGYSSVKWYYTDETGQRVCVNDVPGALAKADDGAYMLDLEVDGLGLPVAQGTAVLGSTLLGPLQAEFNGVVLSMDMPVGAGSAYFEIDCGEVRATGPSASSDGTHHELVFRSLTPAETTLSVALTMLDDADGQAVASKMFPSGIDSGTGYSLKVGDRFGQPNISFASLVGSDGKGMSVSYDAIAQLAPATGWSVGQASSVSGELGFHLGGSNQYDFAEMSVFYNVSSIIWTLNM